LVELKVVRESLLKQQQEQALAQADAALQSATNSNKFVKGYHNDSSFFDVWKKATELVQQEKGAAGGDHEGITMTKPNNTCGG
jgi:hypothetical protein